MDVAIMTCEQCETPLEKGDLRCSVCGFTAPLAHHHVVVEKKQVLRCTGCGAAIAYDAKRQAPACSFCNSLVKLETIEDPVEQTEGYLPFTVTSDDARRALQAWLNSLGWFRPSDLTSSAQIRELKPLWWVAWAFDADAVVSWTADSNHGSRRSAWAPHAGQSQCRFRQVLTSASRGLSQLEASRVSDGVNLQQVHSEPMGADDAVIEQFDTQRSQARQQIANAVYDEAKQAVRSEVPGTSIRNLNISLVVTGLTSKRLSLPAYVMAYQYKERLYRVVICGQDTKFLVGNAPYSVFKMVMVGLVIGLVAIIFLGIAASS